jgi:hypothetical protein
MEITAEVGFYRGRMGGDPKLSVFSSWYQRLRQRKTAQVSIIACARRLCEIAYHLLKERRCYEERPLSQA